MKCFVLLVIFIGLCSIVDCGGKKKQRHHVKIYVPHHVKHKHHTKIIFIHKHDKKDHNPKKEHKGSKNNKEHNPVEGKKKHKDGKVTHHHIIHHYHPTKKDGTGHSLSHKNHGNDGDHHYTSHDNGQNENYHKYENFHGYHHEYDKIRDYDPSKYNNYEAPAALDNYGKTKSYKSQHVQISTIDPLYSKYISPNQQIVVTSAYKVRESIPRDRTTKTYEVLKQTPGKPFKYTNVPSFYNQQVITDDNDNEDYTQSQEDDFDVESKEYDHYKQNQGDEPIFNSEEFMDPESVARYTSALHHGNLKLIESNYHPKLGIDLQGYIDKDYGDDENDGDDESD